MRGQLPRSENLFLIDLRQLIGCVNFLLKIDLYYFAT